MKNITLSFITLLILILSSTAQTVFQNGLGTISSAEEGYNAYQTIDGGYIVAQFTDFANSSGSYANLVKTDSSGIPIWSKIYGGFYHSYGYDVKQTADSGFILTGSSVSAGSLATDAYLIKTDKNGDTLWTKTIGGNGFYSGNSVEITYDGGYIICGYSKQDTSGFTDVYLTKTDPNGEVVWSKTLGGSRDDRGLSMTQTADSGYIICGFTQS